ncbi:MAG: RluA family pseudouridine synthase [Vicinamibacterales bacterium]|jgi:23S rRNA pseudouridine1911/1915/1917 synthase
MSQGKGPGTKVRRKRGDAAAPAPPPPAVTRPALPSVQFTADADNQGDRLDRFLAGEIADYSRSQIQRLIEQGHVTHSRYQQAKANSDIREGDVISVALPAPTATAAQAENLPLEILFDDADIVVVNKPAGMVVHPAAGNPSGTLVNALLHHVKDLSGIGGEIRPGIVHRLDKGTSGVMVVAKNDDAHRELTRQFHDREVEKEYVALAWGLVQQRKRINARIGRDPKNRVKMSTRASRSRDAITRVTWSRDLQGVTLLRVAIATGRTHQIRVHLSAIGHPIVGDSLYGGVHRRVPHPLKAVTRLTRPFLHAERLVITHPRTGERMEFTAPIPADLEAIAYELAPPEIRETVFARVSIAEETHHDEDGEDDEDDK